MKITLRTSVNDSKVKYIPFRSMSEGKETYAPFTLKNISEEVKEASPIGRERIKNQLQKIMVLSSSMLSLILTPTLALAADPSVPSVASVWELGRILTMIAVVAAVAIAMIFLVSAGVLRMLGKHKEAKEWTSNIIKGLVHSLMAIPLVMVIYQVAKMLFQDLDFLSGII